MPDAALYKVAYDEAVRALTEQQAAIESVRSRAGLLLSAAAVTTSFLGAQALRSGGSHLFSGFALCGFVAVAATSLAILWPRRWESTANPRSVVKGFIESADAIRPEDLHRDLSLHMHSSYLVNHRGLQELHLLFQAASSFLTVEVVLWIGAIALDL